MILNSCILAFIVDRNGVACVIISRRALIKSQSVTGGLHVLCKLGTRK